MKTLATSLFIIAILACVLLLADRYIRISRFIEPFEGSYEARCGVDMAPCDFPLQCINGYCKSATPPNRPASTGLPVLP